MNFTELFTRLRNFKKPAISSRGLALLVGGLALLAIITSQATAGVLSPGGGDQPLVQLEADQQAVDVGAQPPAAEPATKPGNAALEATQTAPSRSQPAAPIATPPPPAVAEAMRRPSALVLLNPANARPGSSVGVTGNGFDPGAQITLLLKRNADDKGTDLGFVQADSGGSFGGFSFTLPQEMTSGQFIILASQQGSAKQATAAGRLVPNSPTVKLGTNVGQPGDEIAFSVGGFAPEETVQIFFNSLNSEPIGQVKTDKSGNVRLGKITVPVGAVGNNSLIFVGDLSQAPVTQWFLMLNLFPVVELSSYASKADHTLGLAGKGFGPNERIRVHLNTVDGPPIGVIQADAKGGFNDPNAFTIPFELNGKNTLIFIGEQTQAPATAGFDVLPYTPMAEPSTYGGRPGTAVTFYGSGFARTELVHVFIGRGQGSQGREVACFKADNLGNLRSSGSFTIPSSIKPGKLVFTLVGSRSGAATAATMEVTAAGGPLAVDIPEQPFTCTLVDELPTEPAPAAPSGDKPPVTEQAQPQGAERSGQAAPTTGNAPAKPTASPAASQPSQPGRTPAGGNR